MSCFGIVRASTIYTWATFDSFSGTSSPTSQSRSLRGLAISSDDQNVYAGFIQGTTSANVREIQAAGASTINTATLPNTISAGATKGLYYQAKGVAADDRGNVYVTTSNGGNNGSFPSTRSQQFKVFNSTLGLQATVTSIGPGTGTSSQYAGASVQQVGGTYYLYLTRNKPSANVSSTIERWNVTNPASPVLDTTFGTSGYLDIRTLTSNANAYVNGLEVAPDGTIYAAGGFNSNIGTIRGDTLFKIDPSLLSFNSVSVTEAMDVALYNGDVYVTEYNAGASTIVALSQSTLAVDPNISISLPAALLAGHTNADPDSGFSGITIASDGTIYVADQEYLTIANSTEADRILVGHILGPAAVPTPAAFAGGVVLLAAMGLVRRQRARRATV